MFRRATASVRRWNRNAKTCNIAIMYRYKVSSTAYMEWNQWFQGFSISFCLVRTPYPPGSVELVLERDELCVARVLCDVQQRITQIKLQYWCIFSRFTSLQWFFISFPNQGIKTSHDYCTERICSQCFFWHLTQHFPSMFSFGVTIR